MVIILHTLIILNNHLHNSYNNYYWLPIIASTVKNSNNPLHIRLGIHVGTGYKTAEVYLIKFNLPGSCPVVSLKKS